MASPTHTCDELTRAFSELEESYARMGRENLTLWRLVIAAVCVTVIGSFVTCGLAWSEHRAQRRLHRMRRDNERLLELRRFNPASRTPSDYTITTTTTSTTTAAAGGTSEQERHQEQEEGVLAGQTQNLGRNRDGNATQGRDFRAEDIGVAI